jgi:hypothetical protein
MGRIECPYIRPDELGFFAAEAQIPVKERDSEACPGIPQAKGLKRRAYMYFLSSAAASSGFLSSLNGATKRPCLSIK